MGIAYTPAPMDGLTKRLTALMFAIVAGCGVAAMILQGQDRLSFLRVFALLAVTMLGTYLVRPLKYEITDNAVNVHRSRPFGVAIIPLAGIKEVRMLKQGEWSLLWTLKLCASNGCFGWLGWFWSRNLGIFWMSCTSSRGMALLKNGRKYIITPERPEEFVNEVRRRIGAAS